MYHQHWDLVPIVRLQADKSRGIRIFNRPDHTNEAEPLRPILGQESRGSD